MALILSLNTAKDGPIHCINDDTGEEGEIDVISISGTTVEISLDMPDNITILRDKLYLKRGGVK